MKTTQYLSSGGSAETYRSNIVEIARAYIGAPSKRYVNGSPERGQSPEDGFDCSGFVRFVLMKSGLQVPDYIDADGQRRITRHANELFDNYGMYVHEEQRIPGDLVFFSRNGWRPTHVGIVGPDDTDHFIHAPGTNGTEVMMTTIACMAITRVTSFHRQMYFDNPIGYKSPTVALEEPSYRWHQRPV